MGAATARPVCSPAADREMTAHSKATQTVKYVRGFFPIEKFYIFLWNPVSAIFPDLPRKALLNPVGHDFKGFDAMALQIMGGALHFHICGVGRPRGCHDLLCLPDADFRVRGGVQKQGRNLDVGHSVGQFGVA